MPYFDEALELWVCKIVAPSTFDGEKQIAGSDKRQAAVLAEKFVEELWKR